MKEWELYPSHLALDKRKGNLAFAFFLSFLKIFISRKYDIWYQDMPQVSFDISVQSLK